MELTALLQKDSEAIITEATTALERSRLTHYAAAGEEASRQRLQNLFDLLVGALETRNVVPVIEHMERIANERFDAGYDISEVQTAINVLEEAVWRHVVAEVPPEQLVEAIGLLSTVLGQAKDALARRYVALASRQKAPRLDLSAMFKGTYGM